jgi:hypothetical protein
VAYREVHVIEVREVLRAWLAGGGLRRAAERAGVDRKTARRYVAAAQQAGLVRDGGEAQLTDELLGVVRPARPAGHGAAWERLTGEQERIRAWVGEGLQLVNIHGKLTRCGVVVPYRTLHRFAVEQCGFGRRRSRVRVADGEPGWSASWILAGWGWCRIRGRASAGGACVDFHGGVFAAHVRVVVVHPDPGRGD